MDNIIKTGDTRLIDGEIVVARWEADGLYLDGEKKTWGPAVGPVTVLDAERFKEWPEALKNQKEDI